LIGEKAPLIFTYPGGKLLEYASYAMNFTALHSGLKIILLRDTVPQKKYQTLNTLRYRAFMIPQAMQEILIQI